MWASGSGEGKVGGSRKKFSGGKGRAKFLRTRGSAELGEVTSGCATQGFWLRDGKMGSQVIGVDQRPLPGRGIVGEIRRGGRRASGRTEERVYRFRVRFE